MNSPVACVATATGRCCRGTVKFSHMGWETTQLGRITAVAMLDCTAIGTPVTSAQVAKAWLRAECQRLRHNHAAGGVNRQMQLSRFPARLCTIYIASSH